MWQNNFGNTCTEITVKQPLKDCRGFWKIWAARIQYLSTDKTGFLSWKRLCKIGQAKQSAGQVLNWRYQGSCQKQTGGGVDPTIQLRVYTWASGEPLLVKLSLTSPKQFLQYERYSIDIKYAICQNSFSNTSDTRLT